MLPTRMAGLCYAGQAQPVWRHWHAYLARARLLRTAPKAAPLPEWAEHAIATIASYASSPCCASGSSTPPRRTIGPAQATALGSQVDIVRAAQSLHTDKSVNVGWEW